MRTMQTPLSEEDVRSLRLGETVYLSGLIVTGRDEMHIRALEYSEEGRDVPECLQGSVIFHCGPIMRQRDDGTWAVVAAGPTTSARMNKLEPEMIPTFNIRAIVGKGGMSRETAEAMWRFEAKRFGPLIVAIDAEGNSLYDRVGESNSLYDRVGESLVRDA